MHVCFLINSSPIIDPLLKSPVGAPGVSNGMKAVSGVNKDREREKQPLLLRSSRCYHTKYTSVLYANYYPTSIHAHTGSGGVPVPRLLFAGGKTRLLLCWKPVYASSACLSILCTSIIQSVPSYLHTCPPLLDTGAFHVSGESVGANGGEQ